MSDTILKAVLIDAENLTVTDVTVRQDNIRDIYALIRADCFDAVYTSFDDKPLCVFVDDEGLLKADRVYFGLTIEGRDPVQLAGCGLVLGGTDREGRSLSCPIRAAELAPHVVFVLRAAGGRPFTVAADAIDALRANGLEAEPYRDSVDRVSGSFRLVGIAPGPRQ